LFKKIFFGEKVTTKIFFQVIAGAHNIGTFAGEDGHQVRKVILSATLHAIIAMPDSQRYP